MASISQVSKCEPQVGQSEPQVSHVEPLFGQTESRGGLFGQQTWWGTKYCRRVRFFVHLFVCLCMCQLVIDSSFLNIHLQILQPDSLRGKLKAKTNSVSLFNEACFSEIQLVSIYVNHGWDLRLTAPILQWRISVSIQPFDCQTYESLTYVLIDDSSILNISIDWWFMNSEHMYWLMIHGVWSISFCLLEITENCMSSCHLNQVGNYL